MISTMVGAANIDEDVPPSAAFLAAQRAYERLRRAERRAERPSPVRVRVRAVAPPQRRAARTSRRAHTAASRPAAKASSSSNGDGDGDGDGPPSVVARFSFVAEDDPTVASQVDSILARLLFGVQQ